MKKEGMEGANMVAFGDDNNLPSIENYLAGWERVCIEFFNDGNKTKEAVIRLVESIKNTNGDDVRVDYNLIVDTTSITKEEVENTLKKVGFINGVLVYPQYSGKYFEIKRKARSDWHKQKALELTQELDRLLHCRPAQYTPPHRRSEISGYINQYKDSIGAKPFIKGLLKVFQLQLTNSSLASWTFLDDTLTQNGIDFMRATVNLLVNVLGFTHTIQEVDESGEQGSDSIRTWYFSITLNDNEIRKLLQLFPKEKSSTLSNVKVTGKIEISSQPRPSRMVKSSRVSNVGKVILLPLKLLFLWFRFIKWCFLLCFGIFSTKNKNARENTLSEIRV